jgi:potassium-transporting ATPase potassium-binding subunit
MTIIGWAEIALVLGLVALASFPMGRYIAFILDGGRTMPLAAVRAIERGAYRLGGIDPARGMGWRHYAAALIVLNAIHFLMLYIILRAQYYLPFNPRHFAGLAPRTAFNTAMSFVTNTNWQAYSGETALSHGSQMFGLTVHNFLSAASGIAAAAAVARAFARGGQTHLGNFWVDLTRITLYLLLPLSVVIGLVLLASGVPETLSAAVDAHTIEGAKQTISLGPVAFQEAIKELGTNGGGFFNANSAHPFENPTALTSMIECWSLVLIPFSLAIAFGHIVGDARQGRALFITMGVLVVAALLACYAAEAAGDPLLTRLGVDPSLGPMEGKEVRFGTPLSVLFAVLTTGTSCGAVNTMHDSMTPLGGLVPMFLIQLGEILPGGVGSGLYGMLVFVLLAVFVAGLMVGRTPEYLGKKVRAKEVKLAMLAVLILPLCILGGTAVSLVTASGVASLNNAGPHGLSEMLYAWTSATGNNGSAFAGLSADTNLLDFGLAIAMLLGRFAFMIPVLALAGSLASGPKVQAGAGTFPTHGPLFIGLLIGVILILGGLQFLPALSLGPLAEHFAMLAGKTF